MGDMVPRDTDTDMMPQPAVAQATDMRPQATDMDVMPTDQTSTETRTDMPPVLPTMTDTDTLPQLMVVMPMEDMDTEPQDTRPQGMRPQNTRPQDMMLQDTEESTRLGSARRSDLTPPTTSTKQCVPFVLLW